MPSILPPDHRPIVIAHRGASGYLPEHTLAAYWRAIELGADFIEPDLVATKDGVLIARHEPNLIETTNVRDITKFADRYTTKMIDGRAQTGFFSEDFTLAEIKELRARQSHPYRDQSYNDRFEIPTLADILELVKQAEHETGKAIGIYPETKHPTYFDQLGLSLEESLITTLVNYQFTDSRRVYIQSFEVSNLKDKLVPLMTNYGLQLPLIQLFEQFSLQPYDFVVQGDRRTYGDLISADSLQSVVSTYASGIGVWKRSIVLSRSIDPVSFDYQEKPDCQGKPMTATEQLTGEILPVILDAHAADLAVHAYTFRNEPQFLAIDYHGDPIAEYRQFYQLGIDGVFSDFPDQAIVARDESGSPSDL